MKKLILALLLLPVLTYAAPTSWDFASGLLQPLQSQWSAQIKGSYFTASSTSNNTFPFLLFTNATGTNATTTSFAILNLATAGNKMVVAASDGSIRSVALPVAVSNGGTGVSTLTGCLTGNGTSAITGSGTCSTYPWPWTKQAGGEQATSTIMSFLSGFTSASSTFTGALTVVPMTSALLQTGAGGLIAEYAGTSCTNQFPRSLSALGVATCASIASTDVDSSIALSATTITIAGTTNQITSSAGAQSLAANRTWTLSIPSLFNIGRATTTEFSAGTAFFGRTATSTINGTGELFIVGSTTLQAVTATKATTTNLNIGANEITFGSNFVSATSSPSLIVASSTLGIEGNGFNVGTTTVFIASWPERRIIRNARCFATSSTATGFLFRFRTGTTFSTTQFCDNNNSQIAVSITVEPFTPLYIVFAKSSSTPNLAGLTLDVNKLSN